MATKLQTGIPYTPTTDLGKGILPSLVRAHAHTMTVFTSVAHDWPMTIEQAKAEMHEAKNHVATMPDISALLATETNTYIGLWKERLDSLLKTLETAEKANPEARVADHKDALKDFATQTFALLKWLDNDLCGLNDNQTDAGRLP